MAEQTVRYRVELDDSDLAQQLQSIRSKLNSEVSSLAPSVPTAAAFDASQIYSAPLSFTPPALPAEGSYPTVMAPAPSFQSFDNANTGFASVKQDYQNVTTGFQQFKGDVNSTFEYLGGAGQNFNTGLQMMRNDMNLSPVTSPDAGFVENAAGGLGIGYDQRMPMFKSDYQNYYGNKAGETAKDVISFATEMGTSFALPALGVAAGMSATAAAGIIAAPLALAGIAGMVEVSAQETLKENANQIYQYMQPTIKNADMSKAMDVAQSLKAFESTDKAELFDIGSADIKATMASFAASGGYSNAFTAEQFKQKTQEMLENFRSLVHTLGMAQEEAAALMGELEAKKIVSPGGVPGFTANLQVAAQSVGIAPTDLLASGMQTTELLKSFGYSPAAAFDFGVDATVEAQRLANSTDPYYKTAIYNVGGIQNALQSLLKNTTQFDNTALGTANLGATDYTGDTSTGGSDPQDILDINAAKFSDPNEFFKFNYNKRKIAESINFTQKSQNMVKQTLSVMGKYGLNVNDKETVTGFMSEFMKSQGVDMSIDEASLIIGAAMQVEDPEKTMGKVKAQELFNFVKENDPSFGAVLSQGLGKLGKGIADVTGLSTIWEASKYVGYDLLYKGGKEVGKFAVNRVWEDKVIGGITGRKFFHWEDYENLTRDDLATAGDVDLYKRLGFIKTSDGRYDRSDEEVDKIYDNLMDMDSSNKTLKLSSQISKLQNFDIRDKQDLLRFLPSVFDEEKLLNGNYRYDSKNPNAYDKNFARDVSAVVDYFDDIMYETNAETGKKTQTTSFANAEKSFRFSKALYDDGVLKNLTALNTSKYDVDLTKTLDSKFKDFTYAYSLQDNAANYYDSLSLTAYGKRFSGLSKQEKTDLVRYSTSEHGRTILGNENSHTNLEVFGLTNSKNSVNYFSSIKDGIGRYGLDEAYRRAIDSGFYTPDKKGATPNDVTNILVGYNYWNSEYNKDIDRTQELHDEKVENTWATAGLVAGGIATVATGGALAAAVGATMLGASVFGGITATAFWGGAAVGGTIGAGIGLGISPDSEDYDENLVGRAKAGRQLYIQEAVDMKGAILAARTAVDNPDGFSLQGGGFNDTLKMISSTEINKTLNEIYNPYDQIVALNKLLEVKFGGFEMDSGEKDKDGKSVFKPLSKQQLFEAALNSGNENLVKAIRNAELGIRRGYQAWSPYTQSELNDTDFGKAVALNTKNIITAADANHRVEDITQRVTRMGREGNIIESKGFFYTNTLSDIITSFSNEKGLTINGALVGGNTLYSSTSITEELETHGMTKEGLSKLDTFLREVPKIKTFSESVAWLEKVQKESGIDFTSDFGQTVLSHIKDKSGFEQDGFNFNLLGAANIKRGYEFYEGVRNKLGSKTLEKMGDGAEDFIKLIGNSIFTAKEEGMDLTFNTRVMENVFGVGEAASNTMLRLGDEKFKNSGGLVKSLQSGNESAISWAKSQQQHAYALDLSNQFYDTADNERLNFIKEKYKIADPKKAQEVRNYLEGDGAKDKAAQNFANSEWSSVPGNMEKMVNALAEISRQLPEVKK